MLELTKEERFLIERLVHGKVLIKVDSNLLVPDGSAVVFCGDCDQSLEMIKHMVRKTRRRYPRFQLHGWNGGPLRLDKDFPGNMKGAAEHAVFMRELKFTFAKKENMRAANDIYHAPCGMIRNSGITLFRAFEMHRTIKKAQKDALNPIVPGMKIAPFWHIAFDKRHKFTYFLNEDLFAQWIAVNCQSQFDSNE